MPRRLVRALSLLACLAGLAGCVRREGLNTDCRWPTEMPSPLDLRDPGQMRHLVGDAQFAEELAIRHGDSFRGVETVDARGRRVEACTAQLFTWIVRLHDVSPDDVERARAHREYRVDVVTVFAPMALLLGVLAAFAGERVRRRFPPDASRPVFLAIVFVSMVVGVAVAAIGELWSWVVEIVRVGDAHLSYRAFRIPWGQHRVAIFAASVAICAVIVVWCARRGRRDCANPEGGSRFSPPEPFDAE